VKGMEGQDRWMGRKQPERLEQLGMRGERVHAHLETGQKGWGGQPAVLQGVLVYTSRTCPSLPGGSVRGDFSYRGLLAAKYAFTAAAW